MCDPLLVSSPPIPHTPSTPSPDTQRAAGRGITAAPGMTKVTEKCDVLYLYSDRQDSRCSEQ